MNKFLTLRYSDQRITESLELQKFPEDRYGFLFFIGEKKLPDKKVLTHYKT